MGNDTKTQTQSTTSEPSELQKPNFKMALGDAQTLYQSGQAAPVNTMSTVVPWASQTEQGMQGQEALASSNMGGRGLSGMMQGVVDSGGFTAPQQQSMQYLEGVGTDAFGSSPQYDAYKQKELQRYADMASQSVGGAGRLGSAYGSQNIVDAVSGAGINMDMAQQSRMDALNQQRFNAGQQGLANASTAYDAQKMPLADMMQVGGMNEDLAGRYLNDELRIAQEKATAPMRGVEWLNAVTSGAGNFGTQTTTAQMPGQNPLLSMLGYGLTTAGGLGSIF